MEDFQQFFINYNLLSDYGEKDDQNYKKEFLNYDISFRYE